ncbi:MAG: GNAT family N-acetyltransferase [Vicinamibacteria bacterium]
MFSDIELARRLERAEGQANVTFVDARGRLFPESGACWVEVAGTYGLFDGVGSPLTQTFGLGVFQEIAPAHLEELERFFSSRGAEVMHEVSPLAGLSLIALLNERGYRPKELTSVMYRPIGDGYDPGASRNERIQVRPIREDEGEIWAQTTARGWSDHPELTAFLLELGPISTKRQDGVSFIAEMEGQPIATAALCLGGGVALLAGACTIPEARQQGAQLALLASRLRYAAERGCDIAMICAEPGSASQRNAERRGFRIAYTRIKWALPQTAI